MLANVKTIFKNQNELKVKLHFFW